MRYEYIIAVKSKPQKRKGNSTRNMTIIKCSAYYLA